jgi:4-amino-4-deoxy-L-arabinose transferase-like glycosyltransferase
LAAIGVVLLAAALRLCGIGRESLWLDEATSLMLARMPVREIAAWTALDLHPPLYYTLLRAWIHLGQSEAAVRGLSALASVLTVAVLCCLGCELFDRATGVTAALLLAVSPYAIWYAQEARMYAWLALLVTSAIWLALRALREGRWLAWVGYVLTSAAALYTHYYAFFGFGIANLLFLYVAVRRGAATRRLPARRVWLWLAAQAAVLVLFAPWLPNLLALVRGGSGGWLGRAASAPGIERLAHTLVYFMVGDTRVALPSLVRRAGYVLCVGAFLAGLWPWNRRARAGGALARDDGGRGGDVMDRPRLLEPREAVWFCLAWLILPLAGAWVASQVRPMYSERYMLPFLAPFLLLMARGVVRLPHKALGVTLATLLVALMLTGTVIQARSLDKPDWRGLAQSLRERARPDDLVLFVPGWHAKPFDYYAEGALDLCGDLPVPVPELRSEALEAVQQATMGRARVWLVWETPHYTDPDGLVRDYLATRLTQTANEPLPGVGRLLLFEREAE